MEIFRFLKIIQRIMIAIVIGGFVPLAVYVFAAHTLTIDTRTETAYRMMHQQIVSGYIVEVRSNCTLQQTIKFPTYCFNYCQLHFTCQILPLFKDCSIGSPQLVIGEFKYCASALIYNQPIQSTSSPYISLSTNALQPPLFALTSTLPVYYMFNGDVNSIPSGVNNQPCRNIVEKYGETLSVYQLETEGYLMALTYLFYTLIPIYTITLVSTIIQMCTRYECKRLMQVSLVYSSIFSLSIIVIGILFNVKCSQVESDINYLASNCLIDSTISLQYKNNLSIGMSNGLSTGFTIAIGVIGFLDVFLIIALAIVGLIEAKMNKLKKEDYSSGYQLHTV